MKYYSDSCCGLMKYLTFHHCTRQEVKSNDAIRAVCFGVSSGISGVHSQPRKVDFGEMISCILFSLVNRHCLRGLWYVKGILLWHLVNFIATVLHFTSIPDFIVVLTSKTTV